ncbi:MAG TPA: phosphate ABC transporter substrate-binding protein PstS [Candidatus Brachybacterium merdigallinarum]|nr:phosphate ABC transporter substrate-binding protein PstS [Candidatus Brachybacterium merdigallinarum]
MNVRKNKLVSLAALGLVGGLALTACGGGDDATGGDNGGDSNASDNGGSEEGGAGADLSAITGNIAGAGASSMETAQTAWTESFMGLVGAEGGDLSMSYESTGSGTGREQFLAGQVQYAGSDAALDEEELAASAETCNGEQAINLPVYISPIAVIFNLEGVESLNLSAEVLGGIFNETITSWDDPAIVELNPDAELPAEPIVPVHRSDDSGTTENFTDYLSQNAPDAWPHGPIETWPIEGGQSGDGTSGMVSTVESGSGTIGYADASQAGNLGVASIQVGEEFVDYSPEAAASAVEVSPRAEGREENDIVVELDRTTTEAGVYPIVLISYLVLCGSYADQAQGEAVKAYASYVVSEDGQQVGLDNAGSAPLTEGLAADAQAAIDSIAVG